MKKLSLFILALLSSFNVCLAGDDFTLPIDIEPRPNVPLDPHRSPMCADVYGVFNTITQTLTITVNTDDTVAEVNIYKDGVLVVEDVNPVVTIYSLAVYGSGTYQVEVTTESGAVYTGSFYY